MQSNHPNERDLFAEALDRPSPEDRAAFIEDACGSDVDLKRRLKALLEAHEGAGRFLSGTPGSTGGATLPDESAEPGRMEESGAMIDRFRLLNALGEGGFGVVYLARQTEPITRDVALKIIKLGMDTRRVVNRFEAERQTLALMSHKNIARVLDGGATRGGRPYFVMELVSGPPITRFCDTRRLSLPRRLELFVQVCEGIQHAHQKGIIHRDIKPSNVLVATEGDQPVPKVIDFGIAKATQMETGRSNAFTRGHEFLGTPAYMSPEQTGLPGVDVDTRSDVYSLGILLYELMTGHTPFDRRELPNGDPESLRRAVREEEAPLPSLRLKALSEESASRVLEHYGTQRPTLVRSIRGELDWIVMKAIDKDRSRRYESVSALAADIRRFLRQEPVTAAAPSLIYLGRKFVARNRTSVIGAGTAGVCVVVAALFVAGLVRRTNEAHQTAQSEAAVAQAVNIFLNEDLFSQADPEAQPDREIRLRTVLDRAAASVASRFQNQPLVEAAIRMTLGRSYESLAEFQAAEPHLRRAYELRFHELGVNHLKTIETLSDLALLVSAQRKYGDALEIAERSLDSALVHLGHRHLLTAKCLARLSRIQYLSGDVGLRRRASDLAREALALFKTLSERSPEDEALALQTLGRIEGREGRPLEGERLLREAADLLATRLGATHPQTLSAESRLIAYAYDHAIAIEEAERRALSGIEIARRTLGESHFRTLTFRENLSLLYHYRLDDRLADAFFQELHLFEFRPGGLLKKDLARLRRLTDSGYLARLPELVPLPSNRWLQTAEPPTATWTRLRFDADPKNWRATATTMKPELWMRQTFELSDLPEPGLLVVIHHPGAFEVFINGLPATRVPPARLGRLTLLLCDRQAMAGVRPARNVIAVHGTNLTVGEPIRLELRRVPDLQAGLAPQSSP